VLVLLFRSRATLEAEILILRHQLNIQRRHLPKRLTLGAMDRLIFVGLYRLVPSTLNALTIVKPETVIGPPVPTQERLGLDDRENFRINGNQRYSWIKNQRSWLVSRMRHATYASRQSIDVAAPRSLPQVTNST
jgi:hypothetical protein